jgi:hypothetical protein
MWVSSQLFSLSRRDFGVVKLSYLEHVWKRQSEMFGTLLFWVTDKEKSIKNISRVRKV